MEMTEGSVIHQVLVKLLDGKHKVLNFTTPSISTLTLKRKIRTLTSIPSHLQLLLPSNSFHPLRDNQTLNLSNMSPETGSIINGSPEQGNFPVVVNLLVRRRDGKGGFGSLLRGAATNAGKKKTNNFDVCRDVSGRRLRLVDVEKKLEEWIAEAEERKLEKMAEDFLKKIAKEPAMEMTEGSVIYQVLVKLLDGKHKVLNFTTPSISTLTLKHKIQTLTSIPFHLQLLLPSNSFYPLRDNQTLNLSNVSPETRSIINGSPEQGHFPVVVNLLLRLRGGKGGFGSLLRGAATKAGQKKTNNFDACRDMSGRRLRHVNAEKKLEEWRAEAEERKLEKMAEDFLKKNAKEAAKKGKKGVKGDNTDKYVQKYREDSAKCREEVERSVRESLKGFMSSKRKGVELNESDSKKLKIWKGKRIMSDSNSEDLDDDDSDEEEEENEKSTVIDNGDNSDSNGEVEGSLDSVTDRKVDGGASESGSEEEKDTPLPKNLESGKDVNVNAVQLEGESLLSLTPISLEKIGQSGATSTFGTDIASATESIQTEKEASGTSEAIFVETSVGVKENDVAEPSDNLSPTPVPQEDAVSKDSDLEKPLNLEEFSSVAELEVLGMERLKSELQAHGLKCGGTLQERAARLFLLKTTPLEKLPKKLLAKK